MKKAFAPVVPCPPEEPKAAVRRLFDQNGGIDRVAIKLGLQPPYVYSIAHPGTKDELTFARAAALTSSEAPAAAEYLALLAGGVFLPIDCAADSDVRSLTADVAREHGEAISGLIVAIADNRITSAEARSALVEVDDCLRTLCGLRALLLKAIEKT
ncbi:phage regulatory CII family protein [uncultured Reyranella sp.]|uniref:phage regulatory CII family protein n=1 Tax=uncultured Reyranella sp. TaxID=735512 RepID=UPI00259CE6F5|nr:phage regulatory CII family protein [uncultured Reyranella sp.]